MKGLRDLELHTVRAAGAWHAAAELPARASLGLHALPLAGSAYPDPFWTTVTSS
jgi:hypothetical protein